MAMTREEEVNRVGPQFVVVLRVMTQEDLVSGEITKAAEELCVYLPGDLLGGYASEQDVLDLHSTVIQQGDLRILEDLFIIPCQIQLMVAQAHHHRGNLRCFHEKIIRILLGATVLLPPPQSCQTIRYVDDATK